jgi:DNA-binding transcriptional LysR family regulator
MPHAKSTDRGLHTRLKARQLALLIALAERGSLRQAASDIAVSQPAATKMLHDVEQAFGVALFDRFAWGMRPNLYGETLLRRARGMLTDLAAARDEIDALARGSTGTLRVGGVTGAVPLWLVPALETICRETPSVRTFVLVNDTEVLAAGLREGRLDAAIGPPPSGADALDIEVEALGHEPLCVVARPDHPLGAKRTLRASALRDARWILQPPGSAVRHASDAFFARAGLAPVPNAIETVSIVATLALLQAMPAVSVLPFALAQHYEARRMLKRLALELPGGTDYALMTRSGRELAPVAARFTALVRRTSRGSIPGMPAEHSGGRRKTR